MKKLITVIVLVCSFNSFGQAFSSSGEGGRGYRNTLINYLAENQRFKNNLEFEEKFEGSAFIQKDFKVGVISDSNKHVLFRYNAYKDEMLIKNEKTLKYFNLLKGLGNRIKAVNTHGEDTYIVFNDKEDGENRFFKHVFNTVDKKQHLLIKEKVIFVEAKQPKTAYQDYKKPHFKRLEDKFYISLDGENAVEVPRSKRKFIALFGDKKNEIKTYIKEKKKSYKDKQGLMAILKYYNSL
ncbi:hypothetical protein [uncultured Tenacibaculum sp.]|uniref:hypothetical protein n=1 Tax=uncultured Tenacibaculum sp. TaxID=174713 RepID=UPI00261D56AC|nr:hypothetical protein [uncultured Tenacibaculum sp.]